MKLPVREWTCSRHDYPEHCDECDTWHCRECETSEWVTVGQRDAGPFEELLLQMPQPIFPEPILARLLDPPKEPA